MVMKWAALAAALLLGGCQLINAAEEPTDLYTITPKSTFEAGMPSVFWQLAVEVPNASAYLNTSRIAIASSQRQASVISAPVKGANTGALGLWSTISETDPSRQSRTNALSTSPTGI